MFDAFGGIARIARATALALSHLASDRLGLSVHVLHDSGKHRDARYLSEADSYTAHRGNRVSLAGAILSEVLSRPCGLVLFCHVNLSTLSLVFPRSLPRIIVAHGIEVWEPLPRHRNAALRRATKVLAVSEYTRDRLIDVQNIQSERTAVLYNCIDPFLGSPVPGLEDADNPFFLCVSRLDASDVYKGVDLLIRAFGRAAPFIPGWSLTIAGTGSDAARLRAVAARSPARIGFVGAVADEELRDLYSHCSAFVMPSRKEGFGLAFLEAMSMGKPVIAAAAGGVPEVVLDGVTGVLLRDSDIDALADLLATLAKDPALRRRLGEAGRERCVGKFTFAEYERRLQSEVRRVISTR
jgi:glycosyltransferase involved in cell wall biosynthesis